MNIKTFLQQNNIRFWESGKNVSKGYINIRCIFCSDTSNHLGINLKTLQCNCWKCGPKQITSIIQRLLHCTYTNALEIVKSLDKTAEIKHEKQIKHTSNQVLLPNDITKKFPKTALNYLKKRGFKPNKIIRKYDLYYCKSTNLHYKYRIIIPIYMDNKLVSFTSRDITDKQSPKYKTATEEESIYQPKSLIFNYDSIEKFSNAIMVEGPLDVIRLGDNCFSCLGVKLTQERINYIKKKQINNLYIFYDNDPTGIKMAKHNKNILKDFINKIHIINIKEKEDPGSLTYNEVLELKRYLGFFIKEINYEK